MRSNTNRRQVVGPLTINSNDWQAVELGLLGTSGILTNAVYRLDAGGTNADMEVKVICGVYDAATITSAAINAIPAEDVVYHQHRRDCGGCCGVRPTRWPGLLQRGPHSHAGCTA